MSRQYTASNDQITTKATIEKVCYFELKHK